ncbi:MAG: PaaI family thioesterase [Chitinophagaceae bacterium]|nr:PaaI family thioesterase [Chitinophagaceae bacterium]
MENNIYNQLKLLIGKPFKHSESMAGRWLEYTLLSVEPGELEATLVVRKEMTNPNHMLHGGMIAMISDELCGLAFYSLGYTHYYTTVNLSVDYLYSAPEGSTIRAKASVMRSGKKIANIECYIYDADNRIISHAKSNLVNTEKEAFGLSVEKS